MLLVDDETVMLRSLSRVFTHSGWSCETAASPLRALDVLRSRAVDALVADHNMEPFDGIELCRRAHIAGFAGPVVIYSGYASPTLRESAARAAAWAVVPKDTSAEALVLQLDTLCEACAHIPPTPCRRPPCEHAALARAYGHAHGLSPRETEVLEHALSGEVRKQCAHGLGCSTGSVASYWQRIYRKTNQHGREDVVLDVLRFVLESGLA